MCVSERLRLRERGREGGRKEETGEEKTRLPQHDLQIALSPWRLLSVPLSPIQSGGPNRASTIWGWLGGGGQGEGWREGETRGGMCGRGSDKNLIL